MSKYSLDEKILIKHNIKLDDNVMNIDTFNIKAYVSIDKISAVELDLRWMIIGFMLSFLCIFVGYVLNYIFNGNYFIWSLIFGFMIAILSYFSVVVKIGYRAVVIMGSYHSMKELFYELRKLITEK